MTSPAQLKYASSHEWVQDLGDGVYAVGISNHAQEALGDIVFLEFPKVGRVVKAEEAVAVVVAGEALMAGAAAPPEMIGQAHGTGRGSAREEGIDLALVFVFEN